MSPSDTEVTHLCTEGALAEVSFGEWLKRRRNAEGLTQEQLARQLHCSTSALRKFESEVRRPSLEIVEQLADIFHIPQEERKAFLRFTRGDWQAISSGDQEEAPWRITPLRVETQIEAATPRNNLPLQLTSFIGREEERAEIIDLVKTNRLVTLSGAGGIGKTRLSLEVAREALNSFPDGLWFIEFAPLSDAALLPRAIVNTLGLLEQANRPSQEILTDFLKDKNALLILDNCEHVIQACAQLTETLLRTCPDLHILVTSREALAIPGEIIHLVPPLALPEADEATIEGLTRYEAIWLFMERARTALPGFTVTPEQVSVIVNICRRLDGIPLALELAAARVKLLHVEEIAERLDDRFSVLTGGGRTALPRQQTLKATIDWSHDMLSETEHCIFRQLSVFAGGWTLTAAESVCTDAGQDGIASPQVLDLLTSLVNKSLILTQRKDEREVRYHMLETLREYAREKLWAAGEGEQMQQRHLAYFVEVAEQAEPHLRAFNMVFWLDRLEAEHDNIRAALEWAHKNDNELQLRLASALLWFWHIRGHKNEGIEWVERALSIEALDRGSQPMTTERALFRGKALNASGSLMVMNHEYGRAPLRLKESLALFRELGPVGKQGMGYALLRLGAMLPTGEIEGRRMLEQSLAVFRETGDKFGTAECLMQLAGHAASFAQQGDDYSQAILFTEEQLALRREIGDLDGIAGALTTLGDLVLSRDDYEKATAFYGEALNSFRAVRNAGAESLALTGYGDIFFQRGDYQQAAEIYEEALSLAYDLGYEFLIACNLYNLGSIAWFRGEYARAVEFIAESRPIFRKMGDHWLSAANLHLLGEIALAEGDETEALDWYEEELAFGRETRLDVVQAFAKDGLGKVAWSQGDYEPATKHFEEALRMGRAENAKPATFNALYHLGRTAQSQDDIAAACTWYAEAVKTETRRVVPLFRWASLKTYQSAVSYPLSAYAVVAVSQNQPSRAACLFGASENLYPPLRFEMSAKEREEHDQAVASARAALGEEAFAKAWEEGNKLTLDEAVAFALKELDP